MSKESTIQLGEIMPASSGSVDPAKYPDELFELYSIPAFDNRRPEIVPGKSIGSTKQIVEPGDVLLSKIVPHIRRSWIVGSRNGKRIIASGEWIVFRGNQVDPNYLRHVLVGDPFHVQFMSTVSGVGGSLLRARPAYVAKIRIPLPSLAEQRRIAAILDKANELQTKRCKALDQIESLTEAIFFDLFGDPRQNRTGWPIVPLGELCVKLVDGCHKTPTYVQSGVPFITVSNIVSGTLDFKQTKFISQDEHAILTKRVKPVRGDILVSKDGTIGVPCPVETDREFSVFVSVALLKIKHEIVDQTFLAKQLQTDWIQSQIRAGTKGIAIRHLHLKDFKRLSILLPPLPLQKEFVRRIAAVEKLKAAHRAALSEMDALFASLQYRAFRGEL